MSEQLQKQVEALEDRVAWALHYLRGPTSGIVTEFKDGTYRPIGNWQKWFADALEMGGRYKVDRELLGLTQREAKKVIAARKRQKASAEVAV